MFDDRTVAPKIRAVSAPAWDRHVAKARATCAGSGIAHPLFRRTDEELAQALLQIEVLGNPAAKLAQMDAFFAKYGFRRGDDKRVAA